MDDGWQLRTAGGWQPKPEPFPELTKGTDVLRNLLFERLGRSNVILNVLAFPDMEGDPKIEAHASASGAQAIRGTECLLELAESCDIYYPSAPTEIDEEAAAVAGSWLEPALLRIQAGNVIIYMTSGSKASRPLSTPGSGVGRGKTRESHRVSKSSRNTFMC